MNREQEILNEIRALLIGVLAGVKSSERLLDQQGELLIALKLPEPIPPQGNGWNDTVSRKPIIKEVIV